MLAEPIGASPVRGSGARRGTRQMSDDAKLCGSRWRDVGQARRFLGSPHGASALAAPEEAVPDDGTGT
jgi:hypothetical protein